METEYNHLSLHLYGHVDGTVTVNVVASTYPSRGHWTNTRQTILDGRRLDPDRAEIAALGALRELIHRARQDSKPPEPA